MILDAIEGVKYNFNRRLNDKINKQNFYLFLALVEGLDYDRKKSC